MTDVDSEIVEDTKNTPLADVTDDSCELKLIEIVPLDRTSDDDYKREVIPPVKPEVLQDVKQEPADDYDTEDACLTTHVRCYILSRCLVVLQLENVEAVRVQRIDVRDWLATSEASCITE